MQWAKNKQSGFTIVELLIVVVVIAILAAITIVAYNGIQQQASRSVAQNATSQAVKKVMTYAIEHGDDYPADLAVVGIVSDDSTEYLYSVDNTTTPKTFCITATVKGLSYYQNNTNHTNPTAGACPTHAPGQGGGTPEPEEPEPLTCATGYIVVPGNSTFGTNDFCVMKYEAKNSGGVAVSIASNNPWVSINQTSALLRASEACSGCKLISEAEWLTIAHNIASVGANWSSGTVGTGYIFVGHTDGSPSYSLNAGADTSPYQNTGNTSGAQRRILRLTNGEIIWDFSGNVNEWTSGQSMGGQPGAGTGYASREWNSLSSPGALTPNPAPSFGTPAAANWTATANNIGMAYTSATETSLRGFIRGGAYNYGTMSGIFLLNASYTPSTSNVTTGFRVTY